MTFSKEFVHRLNAPQTRRMFGIVVRLLRVRKQETLRSLAPRVGFSHAHLRKVELARTPITEKILSRLTACLDIDVDIDEAEFARLQESIRSIENAILYLDIKEIERQYERLESYDYDFSRSLWMADHLLLKLAFRTFIPPFEGEIMQSAVGELDVVAPLFEPVKRRRYYTFRGAYDFLNNDFDSALDYYKRALSISEDDAFTALLHYLIGNLYAQTYHIPYSNRYLKEAERLFKATKNNVRAKHCQVLISMNAMKAARFDGVETAIEEGISFARRNDLSYLESNLYVQYAIYYYLQNAPSKALKMLDYAGGDNVRVDYYRGLLHMEKSDYEKALECTSSRSTSHAPADARNALYYQGIDFIRSYCSGVSYEDTLKEFYETARLDKAYIEMRTAYDYLVSIYTASRRYKDAYQLTEEIIDITQRVIY